MRAPIIRATFIKRYAVLQKDIFRKGRLAERERERERERKRMIARSLARLRCLAVAFTKRTPFLHAGGVQ